MNPGRLQSAGDSGYDSCVASVKGSALSGLQFPLPSMGAGSLPCWSLGESAGMWVSLQAQCQLPGCSEGLGGGISGGGAGRGLAALGVAGFSSSALPLLVLSRASPPPSLLWLAELRGHLLQAVFPNAWSALKGSLAWAGWHLGGRGDFAAASCWASTLLTSSSPSSRAVLENLLSSQAAALLLCPPLLSPVQTAWPGLPGLQVGPPLPSSAHLPPQPGPDPVHRPRKHRSLDSTNARPANRDHHRSRRRQSRPLGRTPCLDLGPVFCLRVPALPD